MNSTDSHKPEHRLRQILELTRDHWDAPTERDAVRENFRKGLLLPFARTRGGGVLLCDRREGFLSHLQIEVLRQSRHASLAVRPVGHITRHPLCRRRAYD